MASKNAYLQIHDDVAILTLDRPSLRNAMNTKLLEELASAIGRLQVSRDVLFLVIRGAGGHFSAGADLRELQRSSPEAVRRMAQLAVDIFNALERLPIVSIAAIDGAAVGGGLELAEACSLRICAQDSRLGHPEVHVGAVAGFGGTTRLMRTVGRGRATEMLLSGRLLTATEALELGIVTHVVPTGSVMDAATDVIGTLRKAPAHALRATLLAIAAAADAPLDSATRAGAAFFGLAASEPAFHDAVSVFLQHRNPSPER